MGNISSKGGSLGNKDYADIDRLKKQSTDLEMQLSNISNNINQGQVRWGEIRKKVTGVLAKNDGNSAVSQFLKYTKADNSVSCFDIWWPVFQIILFL